MAESEAAAKPDSNRIKRLFALVEKTANYPVQSTAVESWESIFGLNGVPEKGRPREVARLLGICTDEVVAVRKEVAAQLADPKVFDDALSLLESIFRVRNIGARWDTAVRNVLDPTETAMLKSLTGTLAYTEVALSSDDLKHAQGAIGEARKAVEAAQADAHIKDFLRDQIALMERALREYPIRGAIAFHSASEDAGAAWILGAHILTAPAVTAVESAVEAMVSVWHLFQRFARKAGRGFMILATVFTTAGHALHMAERLNMLSPDVEAVVDVVFEPDGSGGGVHVIAVEPAPGKPSLTAPNPPPPHLPPGSTLGG